MANRTNRTTLLTAEQARNPQWFVVDATDQVLGRLASDLAMVLMGKHSPKYTAHVASGDAVIVLNADKIRLTGRKLYQEEYHHYTHYPGGYKTTSMFDMMQKHPERVISEAVRRMLPKNRLASVMLKRLHVYRDDQHPHQAQQPVAVDASAGLSAYAVAAQKAEQQ